MCPAPGHSEPPSYERPYKTDRAEPTARPAAPRRNATIASLSAITCLSAPGLVMGGKKSQNAVTPTNASVSGVASVRGGHGHRRRTAHHPSATAHAPCSAKKAAAA